MDSNQSKKSSRCRSEAMNKFIELFALDSVHENDNPTFHHNNQMSESQIDHIFHNIPNKSTATISLHKHLCKLNNSANFSSHDALVAKIALPVVTRSNNEVDYTSTYTPFIVPKPNWNESGLFDYQKETSTKLKSLAAEFNQPEFIPVLCELFSKTLVMSAENNFETTNPRPRNKNSAKKKVFISEKLKVAHTEHETNTFTTYANEQLLHGMRLFVLNLFKTGN